MRTDLFVAAAVSAVLLGSTAAAQPAASAQGSVGGAPGAQSATNAPAPSVGGPPVGQANPGAQTAFTDQQLRSFAAVTVQLQRNQGRPQDPTDMAAAVQSSGLTVEQYNEIARRMQVEPAFNARVQQLAPPQAAQAPKAPAAAQGQAPRSGQP